MKSTVLGVHQLKVRPEYFPSLLAGTKRCELRPDDRDFRIGDYLVLQPHEPRKTDADFDREIVLRITDKLDRSDTFGTKALKPGWVLLSVSNEISSDTVETIRTGITVQIIKPVRAAPKKRGR